MTLNILFVDDETMVLDALRRSLKAKSTGWNFQFVDSVDKCWQLFETERFDVVVTDMQMPDVSGSSFMASLRNYAPSTVRMVLSGFKDHHEVVRSTGVHRFLTKPIMATNLVDQIAEATRHAVDDDKRSMLLGAAGILTTAQASEKLRAVLDSPQVRISDIAMCVQADPGLTAKVLQLGNSSVFANQAVLNIEQCLSAIGIDLFRTLVATEDVFFSFARDDGRNVAASAVIEHARDVAFLAMQREQFTSSDQQQAAYLGAMLHVAGTLLEIQHDQVDAVRSCVCEHSAALTAAMLQCWGIPLPIIREVERIGEELAATR